MHGTIGKLYYLVINVSKRTVIYALETCDVDHNKSFIEEALRSSFNRLKSPILDIFLIFWI